MNKLAVLALLGLLLPHQEVSAKQIYDHVNSDVTIYSQLNFEKQVTKNRDKGISIVHYYKESGKSNT